MLLWQRICRQVSTVCLRSLNVTNCGVLHIDCLLVYTLWQGIEAAHPKQEAVQQHEHNNNSSSNSNSHSNSHSNSDSSNGTSPAVIKGPVLPERTK
jgi:hypothetical protein